jgi:hypothetical protein
LPPERHAPDFGSLFFTFAAAGVISAVMMWLIPEKRAVDRRWDNALARR